MDSRGVPMDSPRRPSRVAVIVLLTGLLVTVTLTVTTTLLYDRNENRLLGLRAKQLALVLTTAIAPTQVQLTAAAELANATGGDAARFRTLVEPQVGGKGGFASTSLWPLGSTHPAPLVVVGAAPKLSGTRATELFSRAAASRGLSVVAMLQAPRPSIGYAFTTSRNGHGFVVYAERPLAANRRSRLESNTAFSDLDYALYFGGSASARNLLVTSLKRLPITSRSASTKVPFGDRALTLVITPRGSLGGNFFRVLPWIVLGLGLLLTLAAGLLADRLVRGRRRAEELASVLDRLAAETEHMYDEQRSIAQTLQHALLPETLPDVGGLRVSARYVAATSGVDVGGDWYDLIPAGEHRALLVIGDVSGHGLRAATTMASLRHATLAYAAHDARPAMILQRLSQYVNASRHDYFATVLCVLIDVPSRRLTVASAGHLPPLLIEEGKARFMEMTPSAPIGVSGQSDYLEAVTSVGPHTTLVAFTDGLVERRDEVIDVGLARLRGAAAEHEQGVDELVATLPQELASGGHHDDTAIVGIQWQS